MAVKFTNNASATLAASINTTVTTIVVSTGQGSLFPSLGASDFFYATLVDASNNIEIVKVTARVSDTLTVVRGQDGTAGRSYTAGDRIELRPVAAALNALNDFTPTGNITATTVDGALAELDSDITALDAAKAPLNSPTLVTPTLGVATATSINKVTLTAPATGSTLTIADGKTLTASNTIELAGTDSTTMTFPPASASVGYLNIPINSQSADYTLVAADSGKTIFHPSTDANARTFTIPANASVAYTVGTAITFINMSTNNLTIAITSDTMYLAGAGTTGSRTLLQYGIATAVKLTDTTWIISGNGLT
jgi:hypothetical protein